MIDYFPDDFIMMIDESHKTVPQIGGMYHGDQSRKRTLVDYGFRLPSALDNRPLSFEEFESKIDQVLFVSATPGQYEEEHELLRAQQVIRPTGLLDPEIEVRPVEGQIDDLIGEVKKEIAGKHKILITTLTKRMAEDLTDYMRELGIRVRYLHSDIDTLERTEIVRDMRLDVLTFWLESIFYEKVWIFRRSRLWRFWTRIKRDSCVQRHLLCRQSDVQHVMQKVMLSCMQII